MRNEKPVPCPVCGHPLGVMIYGLLPDEVWEELKQEPVEYIDGGCTYGRVSYVCSRCDTSFTGNLEPMKFCMLIGYYDAMITEDECKNYDFLKEHFRCQLPEIKEFICNKICPVREKKLRILKKDGSVWEGYYYGLEDGLLQVTKNRDVGYKSEKETFEISEIENILEAEPDPDYEYALLEDCSVEIKKYYGKESTIVIPETIDGKPITSIGKHAYASCNKITSIVIPDSVTNIGTGAFINCKSLTTVNIPDGVKSIGQYAFQQCESLTSINIPDSLSEIGDSAFFGCKNLTSVTIPDHVTKIGNYAFSNCENLTAVNIPDSVTEIGADAFSRCPLLTVTIPSGHAYAVQYLRIYEVRCSFRD